MLDSAELAEARAWLSGPDAAELGVDSDVMALDIASRRAIDSLKRRKRMRTQGAILGLTVALVAISVFAYEAVLARRQAEKSADEARANAAEVLIGAGSTAIANGHPFDAMHRFALAIRTLPDSSPLQGTMSRSLGFLARETPRLESILEHAGRVQSVAFTRDGTRIVTISDDKTARVWNVVDGRLITEIKALAYVTSAAFSPDGSRVLTVAGSFTAQVWSAADGQLISEMKSLEGKLNSASFSPDGKVVAVSGERMAWICDATDGKVLVGLKGDSGRIRSVAFSPDGARIATASGRTARVWNVADGSLAAVLTGHTKDVSSALFSPDGRQVVTASEDETARICNAADGAQLAVLNGRSNIEYAGMTYATFSPNGRLVLTASIDKTARIWIAWNGRLLAELKGHTGRMTITAFSPDGSWVITSIDKTALVWNVADGKLITELKGHEGSVGSAVFSPDGTRVATTSSDQTAKVWNVGNSSLTPINTHISFAPSDIRTAFSPDATRVVASTLPLWIEVLTGTEMKASVVQPLAPSDWKRRKDQLHAREKEGAFAKWFEKSNAPIDLSTGSVRK